jgi:ABC-type transport system substrate-binding protein
LYLQQKLRKLNISVKLEKLPVGEYLARAYGQKLDGLEITHWYNTYPSPVGILVPLASKGAIGSTNRNFYVNPEFEIAAAAAINGPPDGIESAIAQMEELVVRDAAFLPIAYAANIQVSNEAVNPPPLSPILIWQQWSKAIWLSEK